MLDGPSQGAPGNDRPGLRPFAEDPVMTELVRISEELGLYDMPPEVCISHMRRIPCRHSREDDPCVFSADPGDVELVREFNAR